MWPLVDHPPRLRPAGFPFHPSAVLFFILFGRTIFSESLFSINSFFFPLEDLGFSRESSTGQQFLGGRPVSKGRLSAFSRISPFLPPLDLSMVCLYPHPLSFFRTFNLPVHPTTLVPDPPIGMPSDSIFHGLVSAELLSLLPLVCFLLD